VTMFHQEDSILLPKSSDSVVKPLQLPSFWLLQPWQLEPPPDVKENITSPMNKEPEIITTMFCYLVPEDYPGIGTCSHHPPPFAGHDDSMTMQLDGTLMMSMDASREAIELMNTIKEAASDEDIELGMGMMWPDSAKPILGHELLGNVWMIGACNTMPLDVLWIVNCPISTMWKIWRYAIPSPTGQPNCTVPTFIAALCGYNV
jgi:hypothetical protein